MIGAVQSIACMACNVLGMAILFRIQGFTENHQSRAFPLGQQIWFHRLTKTHETVKMFGLKHNLLCAIVQVNVAFVQCYMPQGLGALTQALVWRSRTVSQD